MASLAIQTDNDPDLLRSTLLGDTTGLSNFVVTPIGDSRAFGTFGGDALSENSFYLNSGIVLSTGRVADIAGVNTRDGGSIATGANDLSTDFGVPGTNNDSISLRIDFDADATKDKLFFQYVFGSEEFLEYVNQFNDSFSLELNGLNIAKLPNGDAVNIDNLATSSTQTPSYFIYNSVTDGPNRAQTRLDGYSIPITFEGNLIKNARNTLIVNVQDNRDGSLDSAVFLKGGTLGTTRPPDIAVPSTNLPPNAANATIAVSPNATVNLTGLSATDPDGTVVAYTIIALPIAGQGTLYLNNPTTGGVAVTAGQLLNSTQINQLFFQPTTSFKGSSFLYTATDNLAGIDPTPATVSLELDAVVAPESGDCKPGKTIRGNYRANKLKGTDGCDALFGRAGSDLLRGFGGNDLLTGGRGKDTLFGGVGDDELYGRQNDDVIYGGVGDDLLKGGLGSDRLFGGQGKDMLAGRRGNDFLYGRAGDDSLRGFRGRDKLFGGDGRDRLIGGLRNDMLLGGLKADLLTGGAGRDQFVYEGVKDRGDRITDFKVGQDIIDLHRIFAGDRYSNSNLFDEYVKLAQVGSTTVVRVDFNGDASGGFKVLMTLENVERMNLTTNSFLCKEGFKI